MRGFFTQLQTSGRTRRNLAGRKTGATILSGFGLNPPPPSLRGYWGDEGKKCAIWAKGSRAYLSGAPLNLDVWRLDAYGNFIKWGEYGLQTDYGWEIDHITPKAEGGNDYIDNLRPLHWRNNASRGGKLGARRRHDTG